MDILTELKKIEPEYKQGFVDEANAILKDDNRKDVELLKKFGIKINKQESDVFTKDQILKLCTKYDLYFASMSLYKGPIPNDLALKMRDSLEYKKLKKNKFFIICPEYMLDKTKVNQYKDPLCFIKTKAQNYRLVHKWGNDLSRYRQLRKYLRFIPAVVFLILLIWSITSLDHAKTRVAIAFLSAVFTMLSIWGGYESYYSHNRWLVRSWWR